MIARIKKQDSHVGHDDLLHSPSKCFYWSHSEDNQLNFMYRSEEWSVFFFFLRRERWQQWVQSPSNMRKQLAIKLRRLASLNSRDTYETYQQMQNILTLFVTTELRRVDENNIVEKQTNYTSYQKIPLHWFHLPNWEVTKHSKIKQHLCWKDCHCSCKANIFKYPSFSQSVQESLPLNLNHL